MLKIGLTGGIGSGKTAVAAYAIGHRNQAEDRLLRVLNTDERVQLARLLLGWMRVEQERYAEAEQYLAKAMELDPGNPNFAIQRGDWAAWDGNYDAAFVEYDQAVAAGKADVEMYQIRSNARIRQMESKYGTNNVQELISHYNQPP